MIDRRTLIVAAACLGAAAARAAAPAGAASPVLTITGRVGRPNDGDRAQFDMAALAAMRQHDIVAPTPWYDEPRRFTGPLLRDVLAAAGASGQRLRATALNNYRVDIPADDVQRFDVVVARLLDGQPMSVREKGPLFVMYPFDRRTELRNAVYYSRCIWQLRAIEVQ